jgi:hypothetical protein
MPFALATIGLLLIIAGARGTYGDLKKLLVSDFTGENNFFYWIASIGAVGTIGYIPDFEKFSRTFIALIIIAMIIRQEGFFDKFVSALKNLQASDGDSGGKSDATKGIDNPLGGSSFNPGGILAPLTPFLQGPGSAPSA